MTTDTKAWKKLFTEVIDAGLCTLCGVCSGFCPYLAYHKGRIAILDNCDLANDSQCYQYCPRTFTDLDALSRTVFGSPYYHEPVGQAKKIVIARSSDVRIRTKAQYGGVVTTALSFALEKGLVDAVLLAKTPADKVPQPFLARDMESLMQCTGSNYMACPVLYGYNQFPREGLISGGKLAIVATPCQVLAISKMKHKPPQNRFSVDGIKMVIGLFCTWALAPDRFYVFMKEVVDLADVTKFDVPPPPANRFDVYTTSGIVSLPLEQVRQFTMPGCAYCTDMTSEFADISIGAAEGIEGWNTVIIRTEVGEELWQALISNGKIEVSELPAQNLDHLKEAALLKKKRALNELRKKSGDPKNLLYLGLSPDWVEKLLI